MMLSSLFLVPRWVFEGSDFIRLPLKIFRCAWNGVCMSTSGKKGHHPPSATTGPCSRRWPQTPLVSIARAFFLTTTILGLENIQALLVSPGPVMISQRMASRSRLLFQCGRSTAWISQPSLCRGGCRSFYHDGLPSCLSATPPQQDLNNMDPLPGKTEFSSMQELESRIQSLVALSDGKNSFNLHSPQQVSKAIFGGKVQSTSKSVLQDVVQGKIPVESAKQRTLAALILEYRQLHRQNQDKMPTSSGGGRCRSSSPLSSRAFSSLPDFDLEEDDDEETQNTNDALSDSQNPCQEDEEVDALEIVFEDDSTFSQSKTVAVDPYEQQVETLFADKKKGKVDPYWKDALLRITRPSARNLVSQLHSQCPMGFDPTAEPLDHLLRKTGDSTTTATKAGQKGSFLAFVREQKAKYPDCIILCRCGDFFETFGIDALMLIEHAGLNPMGSKAKAGCPFRNVQATLDCLTQQGFRVAVYEEAADTDSASGAVSSGGSKSRLKSRFLAQIVSAASPTYTYNLLLTESSADSIGNAPAARPFCGVLSLAAGYTLVEVSWEERNVQVSERLTAEAVACRLAAYPPADPLFYVPSAADGNSASFSLPFLPSRRELETAGYGAKLRTHVLSPDLVATSGSSEVERAKRVVVQAVLSLTDNACEESGTRRTTVEDFTVVSAADSSARTTTVTNPLYVETATQLGLLQDRTIPPLLSYILPEAAPAATKRFLRRLLLTPPPAPVAAALAVLVTFAKERGPALPSLSVPPIGKVLSLLRAGQASAHVYGELLQALASTVAVLDELSDSEPDVINALMVVLEYETGLAGNPESLRLRCIDATDTIQKVVSPIHHPTFNPHSSVSEDAVSYFDECIPPEFLKRNEMPWRGRVQPDAMRSSYDRVAKAANELAEAVEKDFWLGRIGTTKNLVVQDINNNLICLKAIPEGVAEKSIYVHPRDRFGKIIRNRYTTEKVQEALSNYVAASDRACKDVANALAALSQLLHDDSHMPAIVQASHSNLILSSACHHAARANALGWERALVRDRTASENTPALYLRKVWPYWMGRKEAVGNTIELNEIFLMTAPNMSGKSTLMRSTAAAALLSVCGLCAPVTKGSSVARFDHLFVRGASADVPVEQKSAFGAEMGDVATLLRCCGDKSLVFVDELGRGTSPRDGTRLAGAVLEGMVMSGIKGIFATHLHGILDLPLQGKDRIVLKRMAIHEKDQFGHESQAYRWTYRLEDGVCLDSMALLTAARFGLPKAILSRAEALGNFLPDERMASKKQLAKQEISSPMVNGDQLGYASVGNLSHLTSIVKDVTGEDVLAIPRLWSSPPSLEGCSCLYVVELEENPPRFYVGETDSLSQRLQQHRAKGLAWRNSSAVALKAPNKTQAREWESRLIRRLAQEGVLLVSTADGRRHS